MVSGKWGQGGGAGQEGVMDEEEAIRLSLTPNLHAHMLGSRRRRNYCPLLFERAASTWWDPKFDSSILEDQYQKSSQATLTLRFQCALLYVLVSSVVWAIYWASSRTHHWPTCLVVALASASAVFFLLIYTRTKRYTSHQLLVSVVMSVSLSLASLLPYSLHQPSSTLPRLGPDLTAVGMFAICIEVLLLIYTVIPLPLYLAFIITTLYSITFEVLNGFLVDQGVTIVLVRIGLQICIHLIGAHIMIMTQVRMRGTFMSVGQSLWVRRQLEWERNLKEKMIHSVMPPQVADWLMKETLAEDSEDGGQDREDGAILKTQVSPRRRTTSDITSLFRPFNMNGMDNVSILFADIVGFTRMSSNKTADQLVGLLNDLFGRFDIICKRSGCEKISTLGDCYYSVSGCPEPRPDHAQCCVAMGLAMIDAIQEFDAASNEAVNMRVGIHTGKVLCGIVGTKRFKFDVWSNDVTLANEMESTGRPGQVHVSEATFRFLPEEVYVTTEGPEHKGLKSYFIHGFLKKDVSNEFLGSTEDKYISYKQSRDSKKASSLPNILDCGTESDGNGTLKGKTGTGGPKSRRSMAPSIDLPRLRLPKLSRSTAKSKTTSLPKINSKNENSSSKLNYLSEFWGGLGRETDGTSESEGHSPSTLTPTITTAPVTLVQPSLPDPTLHQTDASSTKEPPEKSPGTVTIKDPRKDSGIRSRRSSIQTQSFAINGMSPGDLLTHRVSGYYTSSQSSVADHKFAETGEGSCRLEPSSMPLNGSLTRIHQLRKESDIQLIKCIQKDTNHRHIVASPLSPATLFFVDKELESQYRQEAHKPRQDSTPTLASTHFNTYFDILVSALVYIAVSISLFVLFPYTMGWLVVCLLSTSWHLTLLVLCCPHLIRGDGSHSTYPVISQIYERLTQWWPWHLCGASLICLPLIAVLYNFSCTLSVHDEEMRFFCYLAFVALIHLCNFTQLNCWMKNILATVGTVILMVLAAPSICAEVGSESELLGNITNLTTSAPEGDAMAEFSYQEVVVAATLLLLLVWFLNREFEISYRLSFHGSVIAIKDKVRVQTMKNQADWLLRNISPRHVVDSIKIFGKYSENHRDVAIMFASIVNFNELYDEDYLGGKEYLRVLNELVADLDELLSRPEFKNIEKIKTIGSTYMAASGLDARVRLNNTDAHQHIFELVEFALATQKVIDDFNQDLIEFNLIVRIGLNFGDVTAGVIGTEKLYYDIWGDAVNIASRMDSTGVPGRIQVSNRCAAVLNRRYELEHRGQVFVKGKDNMDVYLLKGRKEDV
ncbi:adenylate cyclase type 9-like isoform X3 [Eriocheir sinensis]|uniref:adenylate cyclase type 9-like isoform X3 n=1 Tax=Eriocheir sinensis TaxID=95602 RepID=UPI0021C92481|nr:adenylate cyclase type 9-like isoform X3 [Eriocheir sinensis]